MQILRISPTVPTNYVKFTQSTPMASKLQEDTSNHKNSAPPASERHKFCVLHTQQTRKVTRFTHLLHIIYMHTHIFLHTCRLVLDAHFKKEIQLCLQH